MTDSSRWLYSPDIAVWLSGEPRLDFAQQINCILSASHRTLEEIIYHGGGFRDVYETD